jgi:hypothetical protein
MGHHGSIASSLGSGVRALSARSLALSDALHSLPVPAPTSLSPSASLIASSLAFHVPRRGVREHPLLGPQAAAAARRHRRRCDRAEGWPRGRGRHRCSSVRGDESGGQGGSLPAAALAAGTASTAGTAGIAGSARGSQQRWTRPDAERGASLNTQRTSGYSANETVYTLRHIIIPVHAFRAIE